MLFNSDKSFVFVKKAFQTNYFYSIKPFFLRVTDKTDRQKLTFFFVTKHRTVCPRMILILGWSLWRIFFSFFIVWSSKQSKIFRIVIYDKKNVLFQNKILKFDQSMPFMDKLVKLSRELKKRHISFFLFGFLFFSMKLKRSECVICQKRLIT